MSFSNFLNMKKIPGYIFVRLVKALNDIKFVTMMNMSFSFLGLIKITRSDSDEPQKWIIIWAHSTS